MLEDPFTRYIVHDFCIMFTIEREVIENFDDIVNSLIKTCLYSVCPLILTKSHTNQIYICTNSACLFEIFGDS